MLSAQPLCYPTCPPPVSSLGPPGPCSPGMAAVVKEPCALLSVLSRRDAAGIPISMMPSSLLDYYLLFTRARVRTFQTEKCISLQSDCFLRETHWEISSLLSAVCGWVHGGGQQGAGECHPYGHHNAGSLGTCWQEGWVPESRA